MTATTPPPEAGSNVPPPAYDPTSLNIALVAQLSAQELLISLVSPNEPKPAGENMMGKRHATGLQELSIGVIWSFGITCGAVVLFFVSSVLLLLGSRSSNQSAFEEVAGRALCAWARLIAPRGRLDKKAGASAIAAPPAVAAVDWDQHQHRSQSISIPASQFAGPSQYPDYGQQQYERRNPPASYPPRLPPLQVNPSTYHESEPPRNLPSSALPSVPAHVRGDRHRAQSVALTSIGQRKQRAYVSSSSYARVPSTYPEATVPTSRPRQQWPVQYQPEMESLAPYISSVMSPYPQPYPSRVMPPLSELDRRTLPPVEEAQPRPKPHVCEQCGGAFSRAHDLKRHIETHRGDPPHKCPTRTKAFSRKDTLQRHLSMAQCGVNEKVGVDEGWQGSLVSSLPGSITSGGLTSSFTHAQQEHYLVSRSKAAEPGYNEVCDRRPPYRPGALAPGSVTTIKSGMQTSEVMQHLVEHGCQDITNDVDFNSTPHVPDERGGSGCIYVMKLRDGTQVAVKCLLNLGDLDASDKDFKILKRIAREIYVWSKCDHPNILRLQGMALFRGRVAVVSPWMQHGNLGHFLRKQSSFDRIQLCLQLAEGLEHMHALGIVHGDIKPANVVMSNDNMPLFTDFGNALLTCEATLQFTATASLGVTTRYTAPEILKNEGGYSAKGDIYAFGMTILEVVTGQIPFADKPREITIMYAVTVKREIPGRPNLSDLFPNKALEAEFWALLTRCWAYAPGGRPPATEVREQLGSIQQRLTST